jgi:hypothetical protein
VSEFAGARAEWKRFRGGLEKRPEVLTELLRALRVLLHAYDTTVRENRFVVGGATERLVAVTMRALGASGARARGLGSEDEDIVIDGRCRISVKASFTGRRDQLRLVNTLGDSEKQTWRTSTIFVLAGIGIAYADPELLPGAAIRKKDAILLPRRPLDELWSREPSLVLRCDVPKKPKDPYERRAASEAVLRDILLREAPEPFPLLRAYL